MERARTRLVLIGASNVTRGLPHALRALEQRVEGPFEVLLAAGHGRAYSCGSSYLGRALPSVLECGLWRALAAAPSVPTRVLLADFGNDLVYGQSPARILASLDELLARLGSAPSALVMVSPPRPSVAAMPPFLFHVARWTLFRARPLERGRILEQLAELEAGLAERAARLGARLLPSPHEEIGWDAIHHRARAQPAIWSAWMDALCGAEARAAAHGVRSGRLAAEVKVLFGRARRAEQPCLHWADGSTLSFY